MPTDYNSTARALALPVSPLHSPSISRQSVRPPWTRQLSQPMMQTRSLPKREGASFRDKLVDNAEKLHRQVLKTIKKLTLAQRVLAVIAIIGLGVLGILFLVFNERIFAWLEPVAEKWKNLKGGWMILWVVTFATAFPPIIGYSTCLTIAGFVYGFPNGWFIAASATVIGSFCSFIVSRTLLSNFVHRLIKNDTRFAALSLVLKHDGLKLLCMIRLCPLPYSISNGAMSTFDTVKPLTYALATAIITPKLLIHIFIGSRLAVIARSGEKMDAMTRAINWASIVVGGIIGAVTAWFIYQKTLSRSRELEAKERNNIRHPASRGEEFSDDPDEQTRAARLLQDDQIDFMYQEDSDDQYHDEFTDGDEDAIRFGHGDEEGAINLSNQTPKG